MAERWELINSPPGVRYLGWNRTLRKAESRNFVACLSLYQRELGNTEVTPFPFLPLSFPIVDI